MPASIRTRLATEKDRTAVIEVDDVANGGDAERVESIESAIAEGGCLLAEIDRAAVGYSVLRIGRFFGRDFIELLVVRADRRRLGVGTRLLVDTLAASRSARVFTSTNQSNEAMRGLLDVAGWTYAGEVDGLDAGDTELFFFCDRQSH